VCVCVCALLLLQARTLLSLTSKSIEINIFNYWQKALVFMTYKQLNVTRRSIYTRVFEKCLMKTGKNNSTLNELLRRENVLINNYFFVF